jgi:hypothetical protein
MLLLLFSRALYPLEWEGGGGGGRCHDIIHAYTDAVNSSNIKLYLEFYANISNFRNDSERFLSNVYDNKSLI